MGMFNSYVKKKQQVTVINYIYTLCMIYINHIHPSSTSSFMGNRHGATNRKLTALKWRRRCDEPKLGMTNSDPWDDIMFLVYV